MGFHPLAFQYRYQVEEINELKNLPQITTFIGDVPLESHQLGLGNLVKYMQEFYPSRDGVIYEDYYIVIPSSLAPGDYVLGVSLKTMYPQLLSEVVTPDIYLKNITVHDY